MENLLIAFWRTSKNLNPDLERSLEVFYNRTPAAAEAGTGLLIDSDIDQLLGRMAELSNYRYAAILAVGTLFPCQFRIAERIAEAIEQNPEPFLVMGQLIDRKGQYCGLHEQAFIVDLEMYRRLNRPKFGNYQRSKQMLAGYLAGPSIHDDYTPKWIKPANKESEFETWTCGWGFVDASLRAGLSIYNLPDRLRKEKVYAYPDDQPEKLNRALSLLYEMDDLENDGQRKLIGYLIAKRLGFDLLLDGSGVNPRERVNTVFLMNTETLLPDAEWIKANRLPLDIYLGPCSGFLELASLYAHGYHKNTRVIYYDLNPRSIYYKKRMLEEFDGRFSSLKPLFTKYLQEDNEPLHFGDLNQHIRNFLEVFHSEENFTATWKALQGMRIEFHKINLISGHEALFRKIPSGDPRVLFAISDIFTGQNELTYGASAIQRHFKNFLRRAGDFPNLVISGRDLKSGPLINHVAKSQLDLVNSSEKANP